MDAAAAVRVDGSGQDDHHTFAVVRIGRALLIMFDYDWFHGSAFVAQKDNARYRCTVRKFPEQDPLTAPEDSEVRQFYDGLETRILLHLRDGFSYEVREIAELDSKSHLTFECEPAEDHYKVGAFVVSVPFDDIVRIEVFAVHPSEKPEDTPLITGFRSGPEPTGREPSRG